MQIEKFMAYVSGEHKNHEKYDPTHDIELATIYFVLKIERYYLYE